MRKPCLYILKCADGTYYVGSTINIERRFEEHLSGEGANYTKIRRPVKLVFVEYYTNIGEAFRREKQIQKWSNAKKEALIDGDFKRLKELAKPKKRK